MSEQKDIVQARYRQAALDARQGTHATCGCASGAACCDPITSDLYDGGQAASVPVRIIGTARWVRLYLLEALRNHVLTPASSAKPG